MRRVLILLSFTIPLLAERSVQYKLSFPNAVHHEAQVEARFSGVTGSVLELVMSDSSPGRYAPAGFAKNIYFLRATSGDGQPLKITRRHSAQWDVTTRGDVVVVDYTLFGDRVDGTYSAIDETHAHLNAPATLVWAHGFEKAPASIGFELPSNEWKVATQLAPGQDNTWTAPNLDRLMDGPIELSRFDEATWTVGNERFRLALHHKGTAEQAASFSRQCEAIIAEEAGVFGSLPRFDNGVYTFILDLLPYSNFDGMEHRNSTIITGPIAVNDASGRALSTVAHEFFHSWNVKRIRPKSIEPFDYEHVNISRELWFAEGFTSYYGPLSLQRAGLTNIDQFDNSMSRAVTAVLTSPGREVRNVIEMSMQAPYVDGATHLDTVNTPNTFISYYIYGQALALGFDLTIRSRFPGKSLDDWMRTMWRKHPDVQAPYSVEDLGQALAEATEDRDFARQMFEEHIYGKKPFPYRELLEKAGLWLRPPAKPTVWLGTDKWQFSEQGAAIQSVTLRNSPLYIAGLDRGDTIVKWNGHAMQSQEEFDRWLKKQKPGQKIHLNVISRSGPEEVDITLKSSPDLEIIPAEREGAPLKAEQAAFRKAWLGSRSILHQ